MKYKYYVKTTKVKSKAAVDFWMREHLNVHKNMY